MENGEGKRGEQHRTPSGDNTGRHHCAALCQQPTDKCTARQRLGNDKYQPSLYKHTSPDAASGVVDDDRRHSRCSRAGTCDVRLPQRRLLFGELTLHRRLTAQQPLRAMGNNTQCEMDNGQWTLGNELPTAFIRVASIASGLVDASAGSG